MLSKKMESALNAQIELEAYASFLYLSMASWCDVQGMEGATEFFYRQSEEERSHMMRIFRYILEMDGHAVVPAIKKPPMSFESIQQVIKDVYKHEQNVTKSINDLVDLSNKQNDHTTHNFLQYYVAEQREEEALMRSILDKVNLIGDGPQSLYFIDKEISQINESVTAAEGEDEA